MYSLYHPSIYKDHTVDYLNELFVTQNVVLRLQSILLKLEILIEAMKKDK